MDIQKSPSFKSGMLYGVTAKVQDNTLLNRGLIDIGGCGVPYAIMANNKDERIERIMESSLYFGMSFLTPFIMLPLFNKAFLSRSGIVKNFKNNEKRILEVSKEYLTKDSSYMVEGIRKTAKSLAQRASKSKNKKVLENAKTIEKDFENVLNRFSDKEELRQKLAKVHERVFMSDFLTTTFMWVAAPWITTETSEKRTHRKGFSAKFDLTEDEKVDEAQYKKDKNKRMIITSLIAVVPAVIAPKIVLKGIKSNLKPLLASENIFKKGWGSFLNKIKKNASNFDYTESMFMSKTIFALMWLLCSYPSCLISARDKYERKDRAIRKGSLLAMYFGGDFLVNNISGRLADKYLGTKIMDTDKLKKGAGFFERFKLSIRNFREIPEMKNLDTKTMQKTKNIGAALYWISLLANMGLIGFATPALLNRLLKKSLEKDKAQTISQNNTTVYDKNLSKVFSSFKMKELNQF